MTDDVDHGPDPAGEVLMAVEGGARVWWIACPTMQALIDQLAIVIGEHMSDNDELHVDYNAMQTGWQVHPKRLTRPEWIELHFEYSAVVVLRERGGGGHVNES